MAEAISNAADPKIHTVLVVAEGTDADGEDYKTPYRLFRRHWKKLGGLKDIQEGERNFTDWLLKRDTSKGTDLRVTFIRYEDTTQSQIAVEPKF